MASAFSGPDSTQSSIGCAGDSSIGVRATMALEATEYKAPTLPLTRRKNVPVDVGDRRRNRVLKAKINFRSAAKTLLFDAKGNLTAMLKRV